MRGGIIIGFATVFLLAATPATAQLGTTKTATIPGFEPRPGATVIFMRPNIRVGEVSTGGLFEPDREWTEQARRNLGAALAAEKAAMGLRTVDEEEVLIGADPALIDQYRHLFRAVATAVMEYQFFPGNRLPTKKRDKGLAYSLGPGIARIAEGTGADYALFVTTEDHYASGGRKAAAIAVAVLFGAYVPTGTHQGYAGLVDLKTGDLVWINADLQMGGDPREPDGARKRAGQLLAGFPLAAPAPAPQRP